ncbi:MAG TPA: hypothetical protein VE545_10150 [Candidatus Dormibacteraeota bacterium]|nr:hypothetical protein [Candidatus Dormibacteraeota bacterium]
MKNFMQRGILLGAASMALGLCALPAAAQVPVPLPTTPQTLIPIAVDTAAPIVVNAIKPKPLPAGIVKFEGTVMNANTTQITVRAKSNELSLQTFALSQSASAQMQQVIDKGGYQYGDKVTVLYNTANLVAVKVKGKPSRPL